jgi:acyl-CoA reductase-like NAD-dependent aldehyde dehydrogenase
MKKVVLELGGSDPFIVLEDAKLGDAIIQGAAGRLRVMGQECTSFKRFIVVSAECGRIFLEGLAQAMGNLKVGDPADSRTTLAHCHQNKPSMIYSSKLIPPKLTAPALSWEESASTALVSTSSQQS